MVVRSSVLSRLGAMIRGYRRRSARLRSSLGKLLHRIVAAPLVGSTAGRLIALDHAFGSQTIATYDYVYDRRGNRIKAVETLVPAGWQPDLPVPPGVRQVVTKRRPMDRGQVNPFNDPSVLHASELLLRTGVDPFKDHAAVALWNLGNEPDLFARPPSTLLGRSWTRRMTVVIHEIDPRHPVTGGLHIANLIEDNGLRVSDVFAEVDLAVTHGYPKYADWAAGRVDRACFGQRVSEAPRKGSLNCHGTR